MRQADLFLLFTAPLETAGVEYMVSGSVASMIYGEPRLTNDIDIILHLNPPEAGKIPATFPPDTFYCPPEEVITIELRRRRRGHFNLIHHETGHKADIYASGTDPLHAWGFARRRRIDVRENAALWVAPPEYVILRKLEYFKEGGSDKHRDDVRGVLAVSGDALDKSALTRWISGLRVEAEWSAIAGDVGYSLESPIE
jgi:hypothetical protein